MNCAKEHKEGIGRARHLLPLVSRMQVLEMPIAESEVESSTDSGSRMPEDRKIESLHFDSFVRGICFDAASDPDWLFEILMA